MSETPVSAPEPTPSGSALRVFKNKWFVRFARQNRISDVELCEAVERAERGLIDADLGGGVIKQRLARPGAGRSGGFRSVMFFKAAHHSFFVFGFAKKNRENLTSDELKAFKLVAGPTLEMDESQIQEQLDFGLLIEVDCNEKDV